MSTNIKFHAVTFHFEPILPLKSLQPISNSPIINNMVTGTFQHATKPNLFYLHHRKCFKDSLSEIILREKGTDCLFK